MKCRRVIVTHGQHDTVVYDDGMITRIPVFSKEVKDTTGAGDAFFAISSLCAKIDLPMEVVGFIGNCVGALKVKTICNKTPIERKELNNFIKGVLK
jgi:sugar/nucleoside kinase (ribokinase family)